MAGQYRILSIPTGRYSVHASFSGFQNFVATGIVLTVDEQRRIDIVLQVGTAQQEVSVSANALQVETTNTQLGDVIDQKKILEKVRRVAPTMSTEEFLKPLETKASA